MRSFDKNLPISQVLTVDEAIAHATAQPRFKMLLLGLFGAVALVLAAVGINGVLNYSVSRRTREIGIRMSLGASQADVLRMVIMQAAAQVLTGTVVGVAGAMLLSKLMEQLLFGVNQQIRFFGRDCGAGSGGTVGHRSSGAQSHAG